MVLSFRRFQILLEYNHADAWQRHGAKIQAKMLDELPHLAPEEHQSLIKKAVDDHDPTPNNDYGQWMVTRYATGGINRLEDFGRAGTALKKFHKAKTSKKLKDFDINPDINSYKHLSNLEDAVDKLPHEDEIGKKKISNEERTKVEDENWTHVIPHTHAAAQKYGSNTKWCTTAEHPQTFNTYNKMSDLHIFIPKKPNYPGEKYQLHVGTKQFMNEQDKSATPARFGRHPEPSDAIMNSHKDLRENAWAVSKLTPQKLDRFVDHYHHEIRETVAASGIGHDRLVNDPYHNVRQKVAEKSKDPEILHKLASDPYEEVQRAVASNKHASEKSLMHLAGSEHQRVRQHLSYNSTNPNVLHKLTKDSDSWTAEQAAKRVKTVEGDHGAEISWGDARRLGKERVLQIVRDPNTSVDNMRKIAADTPHSEVADHLATHPDVKVREYAAPKASQAMKISTVMHDSDPSVRKALAGGSRLPKAAAEHLIKDPVDEVRRTAAYGIDNVSDEHFNHFVSREKDVQTIQNALSSTKSVSRAVQLGSTAPPDTVKKAAYQMREHGILHHYISQEQHPDRAIAAMNGMYQNDARTLRAGAEHPHLKVRKHAVGLIRQAPRNHFDPEMAKLHKEFAT